MTMQKADTLAQLRLAEQPAGDDADSGVVLPVTQACSPQLFPVPSAWWETPAVTIRHLSPVPEEARTARQFVRELLLSWDLTYLTDDAEMIIAELVGNAVRHGTRVSSPAVPASLRLCLLRRAGEIMLAVTDPNAEAPQPRTPGWTGESGRGLQIVGALSYLWGWSPMEGHGKAVWAVLRVRLRGPIAEGAILSDLVNASPGGTTPRTPRCAARHAEALTRGTP
jgi:anti-sigma regulatory factor (Ser/Thr protein kinase)